MTNVNQKHFQRWCPKNKAATLATSPLSTVKIIASGEDVLSLLVFAVIRSL